MNVNLYIPLIIAAFQAGPVFCQDRGPVITAPQPKAVGPTLDSRRLDLLWTELEIYGSIIDAQNRGRTNFSTLDYIPAGKLRNMDYLRTGVQVSKKALNENYQIDVDSFRGSLPADLPDPHSWSDFIKSLPENHRLRPFARDIYYLKKRTEHLDGIDGMIKRNKETSQVRRMLEADRCLSQAHFYQTFRGLDNAISNLEKEIAGLEKKISPPGNLAQKKKDLKELRRLKAASTQLKNAHEKTSRKFVTPGRQREAEALFEELEKQQDQWCADLSKSVFSSPHTIRACR